MREIKFKAWDDKNKIILNTDTPNLLIHFNGEINYLIKTEKLMEFILLTKLNYYNIQGLWIKMAMKFMREIYYF